jgi:hypothetical protein
MSSDHAPADATLYDVYSKPNKSGSELPNTLILVPTDNVGLVPMPEQIADIQAAYDNGRAALGYFGTQELEIEYVGQFDENGLHIVEGAK